MVFYQIGKSEASLNLWHVKIFEYSLFLKTEKSLPFLKEICILCRTELKPELRSLGTVSRFI